MRDGGGVPAASLPSTRTRRPQNRSEGGTPTISEGKPPQEPGRWSNLALETKKGKGGGTSYKRVEEEEKERGQNGVLIAVL